MISPFRRIINFFKKSYWTQWGSILFGDTLSQPTNRDYLDSYEACFLVNTCVKKIAEKIATTKLRLYKIGGRAGREKIIEQKDHPLLDLLAQVNPFTTQFEMLEMTQTFEELLGNSYWLKVRGERTKKPLELWQLRPDWVTIIEDPEKVVKGYKYRMPNGVETEFEVNDVIHFKQPNPKSALYGLPTVKPAMDVIRTAIFTTRWNMNFFYRSARPDTLLIAKNVRMTEEEKKELKKRWYAQYGGVEKAHSLGVLEGDIDIKQLSLTMRDMEFSKLEQTNTQQILSAFGVPKPIVAITTDLNRATMEAAIYAFLSETIEPKIRRIVEKLNEYLVPEFGNNLYLDFEDPTPEDRKSTIEEYASALKNNWLVINEVRDLENLPPLEGGWDFYLPINVLPGGGLRTKDFKVKGIESRKYYNAKREKEQDYLRRKVLAGKRSLKLEMQLKAELVKYFIENHKAKLTDEGKKARWKEHDKILTGDEKLFKVFVRKLFKKQEERIQEALESQFTGKTITKGKYDLVNWDIEDRIFIELASPVLADIAERRGKRAAALIGTDFVIDDATQKIIDEKAFRFAEQVNETTKKKLRKELSEGVANGEGVGKLSERVSEVFKKRSKYEAERIARTEVIEISSRAEIEAYKQSKVVEKKEWLAEPDACEICTPLNGEVVGVNKNFSAGFYCPPAHPNCRCTTLPVLG